MKMPTEADMRAQFHLLTAELKDAQAKIKPKQEAYEKKRAEIESVEVKELHPLADALKKVREDLRIHDIQREMAGLVRALGGQTANPAEVQPAEPAPVQH